MSYEMRNITNVLEIRCSRISHGRVGRECDRTEKERWRLQQGRFTTQGDPVTCKIHPVSNKRNQEHPADFAHLSPDYIEQHCQNPGTNLKVNFPVWQSSRFTAGTPLGKCINKE
ncbi:hypothetical protein Bbelb_236260 [Branchiostoma belcheri]|nr:hypothetical protein Bbelb_236260 [Branchiostoma belcheri]